jgi:hypothetical protein
MIEHIPKDKTRADNYITGFILLLFLAFIIFFKLEWIMSVIVYPLVGLFFYGLLKIIHVSQKRNQGNNNNLFGILLGIVSILFSISLLYYIISRPNVSLQNIINLIAFPILIAGIAGIIKGEIIISYSIKYRVINILIGSATIIICGVAFTSPMVTPQDFIWIHIVMLFSALLINILARAALYLSEFGLSLTNIRNFILFLYLISDYLISVDHEGNAILIK